MTTQRARIQIIAAEAGVAPQARAIWIEHPLLKIMTATTIRHFDGVPLGEGASDLSHVAIRESVTCFKGAKRGGYLNGAAPATYYVASLLYVLSHALMFSITSGGATWEPTSQKWSEFAANVTSKTSKFEVVASRQTKAASDLALRKICSMFAFEPDEITPLVRQFRQICIAY